MQICITPKNEKNRKSPIIVYKSKSKLQSIFCKFSEVFYRKLLKHVKLILQVCGRI